MAQDTNDNDAEAAVAPGWEPDAHGQAAMLLVESLIHGLVDHSVISVADALEIVEVAAEVTEDMAMDRGDPSDTMQRSLTMLAAISTSLGCHPGAPPKHQS